MGACMDPNPSLEEHHFLALLGKPAQFLSLACALARQSMHHLLLFFPFPRMQCNPILCLRAGHARIACKETPRPTPRRRIRRRRRRHVLFAPPAVSIRLHGLHPAAAASSSSSPPVVASSPSPAAALSSSAPPTQNRPETWQDAAAGARRTRRRRQEVPRPRAVRRRRRRRRAPGRDEDGEAQLGHPEPERQGAAGAARRRVPLLPREPPVRRRSAAGQGETDDELRSYNERSLIMHPRRGETAKSYLTRPY